MAVSRLVKDIAHALVAAAQDEKVVAKIVEDLKRLQVAQTNKTLSEALDDVHPFTQNAILSLQHHSLLKDLPAFVTAVLAEAQSTANHRDVRVTTPLPLTDGERKSIAKIVEKKFGGTHTLSERIEPGIIGGLIIDIGDWHMDASIKGKLTRLTNALTA
ncbi:MAG: F0F1 ATP synthase subunit delta [Patescibacteria group bacterium]|jgi:F0F1-type ATP synthase delta subunit